MAHGLTGLPVPTDLPPGLVLRESVPTDDDLLRTIYDSTRTEELALTGWTDEEKRSFIDQQHRAQDTAYRGEYPGGAFLVIVDAGRAIGRLYLAEIGDEIRVVDIALLPERRGNGTGSSLIRAVQRLAAATGRSVTLHVETWNRAASLYERLGFRQVEERGLYRFMAWSPSPDGIGG